MRRRAVTLLLCPIVLAAGCFPDPPAPKDVGEDGTTSGDGSVEPDTTGTTDTTAPPADTGTPDADSAETSETGAECPDAQTLGLHHLLVPGLCGRRR